MVSYFDREGPGSVNAHYPFVDAVIRDAMGGTYEKASDLPSESARAQSAWLESAATAAVHRNPQFQSRHPGRPFMFHHKAPPYRGTIRGNDRVNHFYPQSSQMRTAKEEAATGERLGLERTATGWKYKVGTLVPGEDGQIAGMQREDGVELFPQQHERDETMESWLDGIVKGSSESARAKSVASSKGQRTWRR
jgi:hypothetical protein